MCSLSLNQLAFESHHWPWKNPRDGELKQVKKIIKPTQLCCVPEASCIFCEMRSSKPQCQTRWTHFRIDTGKEVVTRACLLAASPARLWPHHRLHPWTQPGKHVCSQPHFIPGFFHFFFKKESQINLTWGDSRDVSCACCCKARSVPVTTREGHKNYKRMNDTFLLV